MTKHSGPHKKSINSSYIGLAIKVLNKKKKPMKVRDLLEEISKHKKIKAKTPQNTLSSILQRSPFVKRTSKGYTLVKIPDWMNL